MKCCLQKDLEKQNQKQMKQAQKIEKSRTKVRMRKSRMVKKTYRDLAYIGKGYSPSISFLASSQW
uniref:Uncharacterized protein n=1 Tax=Arundo donax TaxID=35708 RepID=A0A0A8YMJ8_ARUDO